MTRGERLARFAWETKNVYPGPPMFFSAACNLCSEFHPTGVEKVYAAHLDAPEHLAREVEQNAGFAREKYAVELEQIVRDLAASPAVFRFLRERAKEIVQILDREAQVSP